MLKVDLKSSEIYIYDTIGQDWFGGGITAGSVIEALDKLGGKRATVRINSPGGVADEGIAIYNALKRYEGGVDTVVDALAASAASVIALAGESRTTATGARWMIHRAMTVAVGNVNDMQKAASTLETYDKSLVEIYAQYMDKSESEIMDMLTAETWFRADESVEMGLSTKAYGESDAEPMAAAWFKHAPEALFAKPKATLRPRATGVKMRVRA
jgi:ATP-dependent Clp protease protease subunit